MAIKVIYCELDALIDTRIGTVDIMNPAAAKRLLSGAYYKRMTDDLGELVPGMIDSAAFREAYKQRNKRVIRHSRLTAMVFYMRSLVGQLEREVMNSPVVERFEVDINIYPYTDIDTEGRETLVKAIKAYIGNMTKVNLVSYRPEDLTTSLIKPRYCVMIMYDFVEWLKIHVRSFERTPDNRPGQPRIPSVNIIAPALYYSAKELPTSEDFLKTDKGIVDCFGALEMVCSEFFGLKLVDIDNYCIMPPP